MKELNKLRMLAGIVIDPSIEKSEKTTVNEAREVPKRKSELTPTSQKSLENRIKSVEKAIMHIENAIKALDKAPAIDFSGDIPRFINELEDILSDGGSGLKPYAIVLKKEYRKFIREQKNNKKAEDNKKVVKESEDPNDTSKKFKKGQKVTFGGKEYVVAIPDAKATLVGIVPPGKENDKNAVNLVPAHELNRPTEKKQNKVDEKPFETGDDFKKGEKVIYKGKEYVVLVSDAKGPFVGIVPPGKENDKNAVDLVPAQDLVPARAVKEAMHFYDDNYDDFEKSNRPINVTKRKELEQNVFNTAKDKHSETPSQLKSMDDYENDAPQDKVGDDLSNKIKVPASVKKSLKNAIKEIENEFKKLDVRDKDAAVFYKDLARAFTDLLNHLENATRYDMKQAQVFVQSLMGPMLHKLPDNVWKFIVNGGEQMSLKSYMKEIDKKYPITGPRNTLK